MRDWKQYEKIIKGWAYKFSISLKEPAEDLIQEGYICFILLNKKEEEEGLDCKFEAALSNMIKQTFINFYRKRLAQKYYVELVNYDKLSNSIGYSSKLIEIYAGLLPRHKGFVDLFISAPQELMDLLKKENFETALKIYMRNKLGWKEGRIRKFFLDFDKFLVE